MTVLGIIITVLIIVLCIMIFRYLFTDPYTLQDMKSAKIESTISYNSLATNSSSGSSSNFAYSIWFYVNDWNYRYNRPKIIFGRMDQAGGSTANNPIPGVNGQGPCPVVLLGEIENDIHVWMTCYSDVSSNVYESEKCTVKNVPIQKWVNLVISVHGRALDIYLDGKLVKTQLLGGVAYVNNSANVYVTPNEGFDGWTAKFQYYPDSLNPQEVWDIYTKGYSRYTLSKFFSIYNPYQVKISLLENGTATGSLTL